MARLEAAEAPVSDVVDHGHLRSVYTYDPNGIPLEFTWPVPGCDIAVRPRFEDQTPTEAAREGADPVPGIWPEPEPVPEDERLMVPGEGKEHFEEN